MAVLTAIFYYSILTHNWLNCKLVPKIVGVIYMRYGCLNFVMRKKCVLLKIEQNSMKKKNKTEETTLLSMKKRAYLRNQWIGRAISLQ